jgi:hypothetical protein
VAAAVAAVAWGEVPGRVAAVAVAVGDGDRAFDRARLSIEPLRF